MSFLGSDGGIFGVGAPELLVVVLIGYFVLGPNELYKLTKEIGKFISSFRAVGTEATKAFTDNMENQIALDEIRKARDDLNDAFSFRRSINWDEDDNNENDVDFAGGGGAAAAATAAPVSPPPATDGTSGKPRKKIRKRVKKRPKPEVPEEEGEAAAAVAAAATSPTATGAGAGAGVEAGAEDVELPTQYGYGSYEPEPTAFKGNYDQIPDDKGDDNPYSFQGDTFPDLNLAEDGPAINTFEQKAASERFNSQLDIDSWNSRIMANEEALDPMAKIMEKIALLEEERADRLNTLEEVRTIIF